jgi:MFS family permease
MLNKIKRKSLQTFKSLGVRNYRLYFIGQGISITGTWMQTIAQTWLVLSLTHSATAVGLISAAQFLPILLLGPLGGVIADRFDKRKLLYFTQSTSMILALVLACLVQFHLVQLWIIYVLAACLGLVTMIDNPTRQSFVMELVGPERLTNAVTLNSVEINLGRIIGPTIAGVLIASVGLGLCFFLNAASFVAVLICLALMDGRLLKKVKPTTKIKGQLSQGFRYIARTPILRDTLIMMALIGTFTYEFQVVLPVLASKTFHGSASLYAAFYSAMSVGSVVGGLITASLRRKVSLKALAITTLLFGFAMLAASATPTAMLTLVVMVVVGFVSIAFTAQANATLQLSSSPEMRGRVMSLWTVAFLGTTPIGGPIIGWISDVASPQAGLAVGAVAALLAAAYGFYAASRSRSLPNPAISAQV